MKIKLLVFFSLIFILLNPIVVFANSIWFKGVGTYAYVSIIYEIDKISKDDLFVDLAFSFTVYENIKNITNNFSVYIEPWFSGKHKDVIKLYLNVCEGNINGSSYDEIGFDCNKTVNYYNLSLDSYFHLTNYEIIFDLKEVNFSNSYKDYVIRFRYFIPQFSFKEGKNNVIAFSSRCFPNSVCNSDRWFRFISLENTSVIEDISGKVRIHDRIGEVWILNMVGGETSFIRYYNSFEIDILTPLGWTLLGLVFSFGLVFFIDEIRRPRLKLSIINDLTLENPKRKFYRIKVENKAWGYSLSEKIKLIRISTDTATNCTASIEVIGKRNKKMNFVDGLKWASKGEPYDILVLGGFQIKPFPNPHYFEETKYENIPPDLPKLLDVVWKIGGQKKCIIRRPLDYMGRFEKIEEGNFKIIIKVKDDRGNLVEEKFYLKNRGKSLDKFKLSRSP